MSDRIDRLFTDYHKRYDSANHFYSLGIDIGWRREAAREAMIGKNSYTVIDIATGTADMAIMTAEEARRRHKEVYITGIDFNKEMLGMGKRKVERRGVGNISLMIGNALSMKVPDSSFDVATCAFALRNFDNLSRFFSELHRVLRDNGKFVILEMAEPESAFGRAAFRFYFGILMRPFGYMIGNDAYKWLLQSISQFDKREAIALLKSRGFRNVRTRLLATGFGFLITGTR